MNRIVKAVMALGLSAGICLSFAGCGQKSTAPVTPPEEQNEYSIITKLDLNIDFEGNTVKGTVKNSFTLFPATARVYVYLYFSESYTTDYTKMQEVASAYTEDLDMNKTLTASYEMQGEIGYFLARMRYRIDSRGWEERTTDAYKHSYSGIFMQTISDDGSLPVFEDIKPVVPYISYLDYRGYEQIYKEECFYDKSNYEFEEETLKNYIQSINKEYFIFTPEDKKLHAMANWIVYYLYGKDTEYIFTKYMLLDIPEFGYVYPPVEEPTGRGVWNLALRLEFNCIDKAQISGKLKLAFGEWDSPHKGDNRYIIHYDKFINLYIGETCIGTCYYDTTTTEEITYPYLYNLFTEGLRII